MQRAPPPVRGGMNGGDSLPPMEWANGPDAARRGATPPGAGPQPAPEAGEGPGVLGVEVYRGLLRSVEDVLDAVDQALARLDEGGYDTCAACGGPIDDALLEADPTAQRCDRHDVQAATSAPWSAHAAGA